MSINGTPQSQYAGSLTGLDWQISKQNRLITALSDPATYLKERNTEVEKIRNELNAEFPRRLRQYINSGLAPSDARARAETYIQGLCDLRMTDLNMDYPSSADGAAANVMYRSTPAVRQGFTNHGMKSHVADENPDFKGFPKK